jgi:hypothetical protein
MKQIHKVAGEDTYLTSKYSAWYKGASFLHTHELKLFHYLSDQCQEPLNPGNPKQEQLQGEASSDRAQLCKLIIQYEFFPNSNPTIFGY